MYTNLFHQKHELLGLNIERSVKENELVICVAYLNQDQTWIVKSSSGVSGDLVDIKIIEHVIANGEILDEETANNLFNHLSQKYTYKK